MMVMILVGQQNLDKDDQHPQRLAQRCIEYGRQRCEQKNDRRGQKAADAACE